MKLINAKEMIAKAYKNKYAIPHININNLEWTKSILIVAQELKSPIILGASEGAIKYMGGYNVVSNMVQGLIKDLAITIPVVLHLDHGTYEGCLKAIDAGFSSIMFDGSKLNFDENYSKTSELVKIAHSKGVSIEAEVGEIGGEEDGIVGQGELASPEHAKKMSDLGIDMLAAGIGNIHGKYPTEWKSLNFTRLCELKEASSVGLVLHGGSGIPKDQIQKAISLGIAKINVNTELQLSFHNALREFIKSDKDLQGKNYDPRKLLANSIEAIKQTVREKILEFNSNNKA
ncbi:class II fructose-1,6-bisphosphate aldolase [Mycoplasmopsis mucosicanis]|uniref:Class II fructose-1,6-bisphosphate aldolase n=1 Tax=Mycoplasmopsis mucosicanis TaxID=458208 RepID=A0A507SQ90_9BACT|nr:class II fructose-1,6-bisphosphate aldolase [Mycoplasmopsis mucosicanis]TQC51498.1 class II fructose-1,6-bisphosphate aldolase [Mycoplasmopsis mucosicanis]